MVEVVATVPDLNGQETPLSTNPDLEKLADASSLLKRFVEDGHPGWDSNFSYLATRGKARKVPPELHGRDIHTFGYRVLDGYLDNGERISDAEVVTRLADLGHSVNDFLGDLVATPFGGGRTNSLDQLRRQVASLASPDIPR